MSAESHTAQNILKKYREKKEEKGTLEKIEKK
jgi:hypothetical protein